jgi:DNA-directed RNA polymerase subunit N (RpoN/RPB10)
MFPVRCYTCNAVLAHLHPPYRRAVHEDDDTSLDAFRALGVHRLCCRRMFLGYVELTDDQMQHPNVDVVLDGGGTVLLRQARAPRTVSCE